MEFRLLRADEIDARIASCGSWGVQLLLYKDARCDQNILDETVGAMNWQRHHSRDNANCTVSIWDENKGIKGMWVEKEDTGTESFTEKEKGIASDSFKRACFNWGIGRELYTAPAMFVRAKDLKTLKQDDKGKWTCKDVFTVADIQYTGKKICYVRIMNEKTGEDIEYGTPVKEQEKQKSVERTKIEPVKVSAILQKCIEDQIDIEALANHYKARSLGDLTEAQHRHMLDHWEDVKKAYGNNRKS